MADERRFWTIGTDTVEIVRIFRAIGRGDHFVAFSSEEKARAFVQEYCKGRLPHCPIRERTLAEILDELSHDGVVGICFDPEPDGSGGTTTSLVELRKNA